MKWLAIEQCKNLDGKRLLFWVPPYGPTTGHYDHDGWHFHSILNKEARATHFAIIQPPAICTDPDCICYDKPAAKSCACQEF